MKLTSRLFRVRGGVEREPSDFGENYRRGVKELGRIYENKDALGPAAIIYRLDILHQRHGIPNIIPRQENHSDLWLFNITEAIAHSDRLTKEDVLRMVNMLDWEEIRVTGIGGVNFSIVRAIERFPQPGVYEQLSAHLEKLKRWKETGYVGTHYFASLSEETRRIEAVLPKCISEKKN